MRWKRKKGKRMKNKEDEEVLVKNSAVSMVAKMLAHHLPFVSEALLLCILFLLFSVFMSVLECPIILQEYSGHLKNSRLSVYPFEGP